MKGLQGESNDDPAMDKDMRKHNIWNMDKRENKTTVQGHGTPVPVQVAGGGAGPTGPSTFDCGSPSVGNQVGGATYTTGVRKDTKTNRSQGTKTGINPFARRDSINRTPPRGRSLSATQIEVIDVDEEDLGSEDRKKRKRTDIPKKLYAETGKDEPKGKANIIVYALEEALTTITNIGKDLEKHIEQNTKREIEDLIGRLKRQVETLNGKTLRKWIDDHKYEGIGKIVKDMDTQTEEPLQKSQDTQTIGGDKLLTLEKIETYDEWLQIADKEWEKDLFQNTEIKEGSPLNTKDNIVKVIVVDEKDKAMEQGLQNAFKERYPELGETNEDFEVMEQTTKFKTISPEQQKFRKKIIRVTWKSSEEELFENIIKLKRETTNSNEDNWIAMHEIPGISLNRLRKMVEGVFHRTSTNVTIYCKKNRNTTTKNTKNQTYALVVQDKNRTYNEVLKDVRAALTGGSTERLRGIRSTKDGGLLLTIDKDEEMLKKIQKTLTDSKTDGSEIWRVGSRRETDALHIKGIDALTTKPEVVEALKKSIPDLGNKYYKLGALRPMANNTQAVTLILNKEDANMVCSQKNIQIGLVRCNIEKRITLRRCNKCWTYGHKTEACKGPDRSKMCFKCGTEGHAAAECTNRENCPMCDEEGHKAGSGKCKVFRRALSYARGMERRQK